MCRSVSGNVLVCELKVNVWLSLCGCVNVYRFMAEYELEKSTTPSCGGPLWEQNYLVPNLCGIRWVKIDILCRAY